MATEGPDRAGAPSLTSLPRTNGPVTTTSAIRTGSSPVGNPSAPAPPLPVLGSPQTSGSRIAPANTPTPGTRGYLRRSGFQIDGLTTYALEDRRGLVTVRLLLRCLRAPGDRHRRGHEHRETNDNHDALACVHHHPCSPV